MNPMQDFWWRVLGTIIFSIFVTALFLCILWVARETLTK